MPITPAIRAEIEAQPTPNFILTTGIDGQVSGVFNYDTLDNLDQYRIGDIIGSLCRMRRYAGFGKQPYSIGAHSLLVLHLAEHKWKLDRREGLSLLAHDFSEAYMNDLCSPFKRSLPDYKAAEDKCMQAIQAKLNCDPLDSDLVKVIDAKAFKHEATVLFGMSEEDIDSIFPRTKGHRLTPLGYLATQLVFSLDQRNLPEDNLALTLSEKLGSLGVII